MKDASAHVFWVLVLSILLLLTYVGNSTKNKMINDQKIEINQLQQKPNEVKSCNEVPKVIKDFFKELKK